MMGMIVLCMFGHDDHSDRVMMIFKDDTKGSDKYAGASWADAIRYPGLEHLPEDGGVLLRQGWSAHRHPQ